MIYKLTKKDREEINKELKEYIKDLDETPSPYSEKFVALLSFIDGYIKGIERVSNMLLTTVESIEILDDIGNILDEHFGILRETKVVPYSDLWEELSKGTWERLKNNILMK